jgi:hypothetical protein
MNLLRRYKTPGRYGLALAVLFATFVVWGSSPAANCWTASADHTDFAPGDWCFTLPVTITNSTGGVVTDELVRFELDAASLVGNGQLDANGWDIVATTSAYASGVDLLMQDLDSAASAWWLRVPSIADTETFVYNLRIGNHHSMRDQATLFAGAETLTVPHHADHQLAGDWRVEVTAEKDNTDPSGTLLTKWTASTGYKLEIIDSGGMRVRATSDAAVLTSAVWDGASADWAFELTGGTLSLYKDGALDSSSGGVGNTTANTETLSVGGSVALGSVKHVRIIDNVSTTNDVVLNLGMDPREGPSPAATFTETSSVDPTYVSTVPDYSSGGHDGTYTITEAQNLTVSVGALSTSSAPALLSLASELPDVAGAGFTSDLFSSNENTRFPGFATLDNTADQLQIPNAMFWTILLFTIGALMATPAVASSKSLVIGVFILGLPPAFGMLQGVIDGWVILVWLLGVFAIWATEKNLKTA